MIGLHDQCKITKDDSKKIWRYMDFEWFADMLESETLYFRRTDLFSDIFEGSLPVKTIKKREAHFHEDSRRNTVTRETKKERVICCWHMNDQESAAMWNLYIKGREGIVIQYTIERLKAALGQSKETVWLGEVEYIDYEEAEITHTNGLTPYLHKRKSFKHEEELRAIIWNKSPENKILKLDFSPGGYKLFISINTLVENVFVSPNSHKWYVDWVNFYIQKHKKYQFKAINSYMDNEPLF
ncbi:hypothetical protein Q0590_32780 [Rhodocytophaga aerolata]|uniref:DUF2971 domain-containing protein n=1 Tax=Rhodocytophaga aerolata TaxID=455078 RepID=A0ABT8RG77_9BACT|nr:hypothetical protein [Rhodocytophaga aerolata]MDO1451095.1 hypothetical protein [Rhodocytophaga aerolata]